MLKHIVMWQLKEDLTEDDPRTTKTRQLNNATVLKEKLESLSGKIPGLLKIEVGFDLSVSTDIVLYSELKNRDALTAYQSHPEHQAVIPFVKAVCTARRVVDYDTAS